TAEALSTAAQRRGAAEKSVLGASHCDSLRLCGSASQCFSRPCDTSAHVPSFRARDRAQLTALAVTCVAGGLFLWVPYLLLPKSPRRWWLYTAAAAIPFIVVANLVAPIWIAPLFNRFEPMHDKALETKILALADRAGIEGSRVFEVDKG
ncbi:MAG: hypothetical protein DMF98_10335, partial [Acidobacteria bacterium]